MVVTENLLSLSYTQEVFEARGYKQRYMVPENNTVLVRALQRKRTNRIYIEMHKRRFIMEADSCD